MAITTKLQIPTADNINIRIDSTFFTADGLCLINGGGVFQVSTPKSTFQNLNRVESGILRF
jgi:hypothetical protein